MRIVHWAPFPKANLISGLFNSVKEICEAELEIGVEAGICEPGPRDKKGGREIKLRRSSIKTKSWEWALEEPDTVSFLSTGFFELFHELPHKVAILHGMPLHCVHMEMFKNKTAMETSMNMAKMCDYSVCWDKHSEEYWRCFTPNVDYVERGCDLEFWKPEGEKAERRFHPQISFLEIHRPVKLPLTFLFAVKYASQRQGMRNLRFHLGCVESRRQILWMHIISKLDIDIYLGDYIVGVHNKPWVYYRSSDMLVSPCQGGLLSRVGVEALACGTPVIILEGAREKVATMKCRDTPISMADAIETVWSKVQEDPEGVKAECRSIAEKHYDVRETARRFIKIAESLV